MFSFRDSKHQLKQCDHEWTLVLNNRSIDPIAWSQQFHQTTKDKSNPPKMEQQCQHCRQFTIKTQLAVQFSSSEQTYSVCHWTQRLFFTIINKFDSHKTNKSVFSLVNSAVNMTLPAFSAVHCAVAPCCGAVAAGCWRPPLSVDIFHPHGTQPKTRNTQLQWSNDRTDRQTDGRSTIS